ncbi:hypothetical protein EV356DRAFT_502646 [Viridothelium virens]|uniref:Rhodopsin domain-containing protein n=1 Tax=Viridothelium virens TaxID=1048519 RepID=A0A6A6H8A1_VIRVR|nr:hypothetical protein EV356DRAFT_502646 [Viridothelium virens]
MTSSGKPVGIAPPPPGQEANFIDPQTRQESNIALHTVMLFFVTLSVGIRIYTRRFITHALGIDDLLCIIAYCLLLTYCSLLLACGQYYLGHHLWDIKFSDFIHGSKLEVWTEWVYLPLSAFTKLSCLLFYRRIFVPSGLMTGIIWSGVFFITVIYTVLLTMSVLNCQPIRKRWNPSVHGVCLPDGTLAYSSGAFNVLSDIFVLLLPLPAVWRLNMSVSKRAKILAVFGLGLIVVVMSITRLAKTPLAFKSTDSSWELSEFAIYAILEMDIALICACLLAFPAFIDRYGPHLVAKMKSYTSLGRWTTQEASTIKLEDHLNAKRETSLGSSDRYRNLSEGADVVTHNTDTSADRPSYSSGYRAATVNHSVV